MPSCPIAIDYNQAKNTIMTLKNILNRIQEINISYVQNASPVLAVLHCAEKIRELEELKQEVDKKWLQKNIWMDLNKACIQREILKAAIAQKESLDIGLSYNPDKPECDEWNGELVDWLEVEQGVQYTITEYYEFCPHLPHVINIPLV